MWCLGGVTAFTCDGRGPSRVQGLLRFKPLGSTAVLGSYDRQDGGTGSLCNSQSRGLLGPHSPFSWVRDRGGSAGDRSPLAA